MTRSRILLLGLIASALAIAPTSSALAGGQHWSHGHAYHGGYHYSAPGKYLSNT